MSLPWKTEVCYHIHKSQLNSLFTFIPYFFSSISVVSFHLCPGLQRHSLCFKFSGLNFVYLFHLTYAWYMRHPSYFICPGNPDAVDIESNHEITDCAAFFTLQSLPPSWVQMFSSSCWCWIPRLCLFHNHGEMSTFFILLKLTGEFMTVFMAYY